VLPVWPIACLLTAVLARQGLSATRYVDANGPNPTAPYTSWATAATNIQQAVDLAASGDLVLVTNGLYHYGGAGLISGASNRVYVTNALLVQSVNGPAVTTIKGGPYARCAYLAAGATLSGFTVTNGLQLSQFSPFLTAGGGVNCATTNCVVTNCVVTGNSTFWQGGGVYLGRVISSVISNNMAQNFGGGAYGSILSNCLIVGNAGPGVVGGGLYAGAAVNCVISSNTAFSGGGAAISSVLVNCQLLGNTASRGGGCQTSFLTNCILMGNLAFLSGGGAYSSIVVGCLVSGNYATNGSLTAIGGAAAFGKLINSTVVSNFADACGGVYTGACQNAVIYYNQNGNYTNASLFNCCTTPQPASGAENFSAEPLFVNLPGGDFHLQLSSPGINAGNNAYLASSGLANDLDGNPRIIGGTVDVGAYEFQSPLSQISHAWLQQYGLATDGISDFADPDADGINNWQEWIADTNPTNAASLFQLQVASNNASGFTLTWQSSAARTYYVQRATELTLQPALSPLAGPIPGQFGTTSYTDPAATNGAVFYYRVRVQH
jgi:hypothetical protein